MYPRVRSVRILIREVYAHSAPQAIHHTATANPLDCHGSAAARQRDAALALPSPGADAERRKTAGYRARAAKRDHAFARQRNSSIRAEPARTIAEPAANANPGRLDTECGRSLARAAARAASAGFRRKQFGHSLRDGGEQGSEGTVGRQRQRGPRPVRGGSLEASVHFQHARLRFTQRAFRSRSGEPPGTGRFRAAPFGRPVRRNVERGCVARQAAGAPARRERARPQGFHRGRAWADRRLPGRARTGSRARRRFHFPARQADHGTAARIARDANLKLCHARQGRPSSS